MPKENKLYELLDVSTSASTDEIKKAFRKKSLTHHPDKGGDIEVYKKINSAYEILSDPQKRKLYDERGEDGLRESGNVPEDMLAQMFGNLFNGGFSFSSGGRFPGFPGFGRNKSGNYIHVFKVTLEDLCKRKVSKLKVTRDRICKHIDEKKSSDCQACKGRGIRVQIIQMGPMIQQSHQPCESCKSTGKIYNSCDNCIDGIVKEPKVFELHLTPELENGYRFVFQNDGNQEIGKEPGDFIIVIQYEEHPIFKLEGKNILYTHTISLKEALCGYKLELTHPSGEIITVSTSDVTNPETIETIPNKGLSYQSNMIIKYRILFPDKLSPEQSLILHKIL
jgi:DnaJ family protein A protein 2